MAGKTKTIEWLTAHLDHVGDECLIWPFSLARGYGHFRYEGRTEYAHRVMCRLAHGEPPSDKHQAAHSCGNGHNACVHPQHVSWKTNGENQLDRREHGTTERGRSYYGRATPEQIEQIKALRGVKTHDEIAKQFGFSRQNIGAILAGKTFNKWKMSPPLTPDQVRQIRAIGYSMPAREVAAMLGIGVSPVANVRLGNVYKHIT